MNQILTPFLEIFSRTKRDIEVFNQMLQPQVDQAQDDHDRLYYHHILEEEEQRLERLDTLLPLLKQSLDEELSNRELIQLSQELNLEKFGIHNFREHLDLALYQFKDEERQQLLQTMRERTQNDYITVKNLLIELNNHFQTIQGMGPNLSQQPTETIPYTAPRVSSGKRLTVGSLKRN